MGDFRDLRVYREAVDLVVIVYAMTSEYPVEERFGLTSQLRRAAVSIPANIAEGWGRGAVAQRRQFYGYARGSAREVDALAEISERLGYPIAPQLRAQLFRVQRQLAALIAKLDP